MRRADAAGREDIIELGPDLVHRRNDLLDDIGNDPRFTQAYPNFVQSFGEKGEVGVLGAARQDLVADDHDAGGHDLLAARSGFRHPLPSNGLMARSPSPMHSARSRHQVPALSFESAAPPPPRMITSQAPALREESRAMTTSREYAKSATATLHQLLHLPKDGVDDEETEAVIERAIRNATRERESRARRQIREVETAAEERLARLLRSSPAVIYSFKASGDFAPSFVSDNILDVFGYAPREYMHDPSFWRDRVHPNDLARVEELIAKFFENGVHAVEYRFRRSNGSYCWVNDEQHLIRDRDGKPAEIVGSWSDITARKLAEAAKAAAFARLAELLASAPAVIYSYKASGRSE